MRRWSRWGLVLGGWAVFGLAYSSHLYVYHSLEGDSTTTWLLQVAEAFADFGVWAALTPAIVALARRFPLTRSTWPRSALVHLPIALALSLFQVAVHALLDIGVIHGRWTAAAMAGGFQILFARTYHFGVLVYVALVAAHQAIARHRDQAVRASELAEKLARAQLRALEMQLHPHFLFNTLHALSALVQSDPKAADQMIARLGEFLRMSLESGGAAEVPLERELEFLARYLEIEKIRFGERLTVATRVDPDALDASVPNLVLQPLVENAIRHGISPRRRPGRIEIEASLRGETLELTVRDDGPGLPAEGVREGIGLSNTRLRLEQLHGGRQRFELRDRPEGGLEVRIAIPFRPAPAAGGGLP